ncbi:leader peptidase (prepilin peptidase)/N-methyltransferase [Kineococcus xinjiangensis]|uniref:Leader peptidase (Prepilin peptidase)/N-methyltransferase n=1 Tax=Kineococcus xinjiangensis TaxID=512762 RepID=A0A2S6IPE0_9ACTN|nr:A24 family peptidase [Kineococcus xinjiangensis]PPK96000.1 leader peptidase (prepilin peptidase)/N-methyltransferase [Kineococcus xinjiangensis]
MADAGAVTAATPVVAALVGLLIGSFLNVVIHRVPRGESVVRPASRCPGCGHAVRSRDNVPVVSWLLLRGRCRDCAAPISVRYPLVEFGTGLLFGAVAWLVGPSWALPAYLYLAAIAVALTMIDLDVQRLPDAIVKPSYVVAAVLLAAASAATGDWGAMLRAGIGCAALLALYAPLWLFGGMGRGDVKLAGVLGLYLGWWSWEALVVGGFAAFVLGGAVGVALMLLGRARRRTKVPFGPSMLAGALLALFAAAPVASWYLGVVGLAPPA